MSGGPHQHPHGRQGMGSSPGWSPLQLPNYFPMRPQMAHMSSDRPVSHSPLTWHTPTPPEHQQKSAPNPYRHTPTPPDVQALKAASTLPYRHTPTPPDLKSFRHTPTPPDVAHNMKTSGVLHFRHTPSPIDIHKGAPSPLFNLQQMLPDARGAPRDRDFSLYTPDNVGFSRHSPGLIHGSMDLSVTKSPRNGGQNGETPAPISLSVRDASKINSLDSSEISKIHQPLVFPGKAIEISVDAGKPSSPLLNSMNQRSNSPKSPLCNSKRPVKKVDSILERLSSVGDGVVITPVQPTPSPQSVIVSAHSMEDSNSRGSSSSLTHMMSITPYYTCEAANMERVTPPAPHPLTTNIPHHHDDPAAVSIKKHPTPLETVSKVLLETCQTPPIPQSVIKDSSITFKESNTITPNCANDDSSESSSDNGRPKRKRKPSKTAKAVEDNAATDIALSIENEGKNIEDKTVPVTENANRLIEHLSPTNSIALPLANEAILNGMPGDKEEMNVSTPTVAKTRRKLSSESETIDNIAAMIASTENAISTNLPEKSANETHNEINDSTNPAMHTEQLKEVLGSPVPDRDKNLPNTNIADTSSSIETTPNSKVQKRKRNSRSQSTELQLVNPSTDGTLDDQNATGKPKPDFVEVEDELEKMFAGIEKNEPTSTTQPLDPATTPSNDKLSLENTKSDGNKQAAKRSNSNQSIGEIRTKKKTAKSSKKNKLSNELGGSIGKAKRSKSNTSNSNKKFKRDKSIEKSKLELLSKDVYDSGSNASSSKSRGPYVQIKGPRDSPLSVSVINTPVQEEDGEKPMQKVKTLKSKSSLNSDSDFKKKVKSKGLHSSTLSMKYDATTIDTSWICVFCKKGPHTGGARGPRVGNAKQMGDLFGPYIVSSECQDFNSMISDPQDTVFKNKVKPGTFSQNKQAKPPGRRSNKPEIDVVDKSSKGDIFFGMIEAGSNSYEVWFHEDCAVWAPGVYLVGTKVAGLDSAVWGSCTVKCDHCKLTGASVACIRRGCNKNMHINCARSEMWSLNEETFRVYCTEHTTP